MPAFAKTTYKCAACWKVYMTPCPNPQQLAESDGWQRTDAGWFCRTCVGECNGHH